MNFKWSDNMQTDGDIMDFYTNGDVAPGARFKYQFTTVGAKIPDEGETTAPADSDTAAPDTQEIPTDAPAETDAPAKKGCKSAVSAAVLPVTLAAAVAVTKKGKKKEEL